MAMKGVKFPVLVTWDEDEEEVCDCYFAENEDEAAEDDDYVVANDVGVS